MTTILIGLAPGDRGEAASHLGAMIARSTDSPLVVAAITPVPWPPSPFLGDEEYLELQQTAAQETLDRARADHRGRHRRGVPDRVGPFGDRRAAAGQRAGRGRAWSCSAPARRVCPAGSRWAASPSASCTVSTRRSASRPRASRCAPDARISRITVGFGRADADSGLLAAAIERAGQFGIPLRVACFAVRPGRGSARHHRDLAPRTWWSASGPTRYAAQIRYAARCGGRGRRVAGHRRRRRHRLGGDDRHRCPGDRPICSPSARRPRRSAGSCWARTRPRSSSTPPYRC